MIKFYPGDIIIWKDFLYFFSKYDEHYNYKFIGCNLQNNSDDNYLNHYTFNIEDRLYTDIFRGINEN